VTPQKLIGVTMFRKKSVPDAQADFHKASIDLIKVNREHFSIRPAKIRKMEEIYFVNNPQLYTATEKKLIHTHLEALLFKFELASLALEQLWSIREAKTASILQAIGNSTLSFDITNSDMFLYSSLLENFLFQSRAFLDFYMFYIVVLFKQGNSIAYISHERFLEVMKHSQSTAFAEKAEKVQHYFEKEVFGEDRSDGLVPLNWGMLTKGLRDKIAHRDTIRHSFDSIESLFDGTPIDIPTLRATTYDRFCQHMQNGMYLLYEMVMPIVYDLEWKSGPYREGLWD
jgi:hypothetical protein